MVKKGLTAFRNEEYRSLLASRGQLKKLKSTYISDYESINDGNLASFWDKKNIRNSEVTFLNNSMAYDRVTKVINKIQGEKRKIADIGFGSGDLEKRIYSQLNNRQFFWYALDISPKSVSVAKKLYPQMNFQVGTILKIPYQKDIFDYVICLEVLEHITPDSTFAALMELKRILKKRGRLILSVPMNEGLEDMVLRGENPNQHVRVYTPELLRAELQIAGFNVLSEEYLYAFKNKYAIKSFITRIFPKIKTPNNILIVAQKP